MIRLRTITLALLLCAFTTRANETACTPDLQNTSTDDDLAHLIVVDSVKTDIQLLDDNKKHLPSEFTENKEYYHQSDLPIWLQQRCAYVAYKSDLEKWCDFRPSSSDELDCYKNNLTFNGGTIYLDPKSHALIPLFESLYIIGHEVGHAYSSKQSKKLGLPLIVASFLNMSAHISGIKVPTIITYSFYTLAISRLLWKLSQAGHHFEEHYADLKACDFFDNNFAYFGGISRIIKDNSSSSRTHPASSQRLKCIFDYKRWKEDHKASPTWFLIYNFFSNNFSKK